MKKTLLFALFLISCVPGFSQSKSRLFGDFNNDGKITAADISYLVSIATGEKVPQILVDGKLADVINASSLALDQSSISLYVGDTKKLTATILPENTFDKSIIWISSDPLIATVENGIVRGVAVGTTTITAISKDNSDAFCFCTVEVENVVLNMHNGHEFVDLGLKDEQGNTIYWATCNVGADSPETSGLYFAWGETTGHNLHDGHYFTWSTYKFGNAEKKGLTKYCIDSDYGTLDNKRTLELEDDAAHVNWGGSWRMPTMKEAKQLVSDCNWVWDEGKNGYYIFNKSDENKFIFLRAAGLNYYDDITRNDRNKCYYWTSSIYSGYGTFAWYLYYTLGLSFCANYRYYGLTIRPVCVSPQ